MQISNIPLVCRKEFASTNRKTTFNIVAYTFNYISSAEDKKTLDALIEKGGVLANKVNPGAANDSTRNRSFSRIKNNCVAGMVAEYCWLHYLNDGGKVIRVTETDFETASSQIDLKVIVNEQSIEVRSSFPRGTIPFVLCHPKYEFDVIGPYKNEYKPGEIQKNFYVRTLFRMPSPLVLLSLIKQDGFTANLTGGATWEMMTDNTLAKDKNFISEDEILLDREGKASTYRVVPFSNSLDTVEIYKLIESDK